MTDRKTQDKTNKKDLTKKVNPSPTEAMQPIQQVYIVMYRNILYLCSTS